MSNGIGTLAVYGGADPVGATFEARRRPAIANRSGERKCCLGSTQPVKQSLRASFWERRVSYICRSALPATNMRTVRLVLSSCNAQKSQPRNSRREIFASVAAQIRRKIVSAVKWIVRDAKKPRPKRTKIDPSQRKITLQYQLLNRWLGREDSNLRMAESKSDGRS
jgi:hypothetical protein